MKGLEIALRKGARAPWRGAYHLGITALCSFPCTCAFYLRERNWYCGLEIINLILCNGELSVGPGYVGVRIKESSHGARSRGPCDRVEVRLFVQ